MYITVSKITDKLLETKEIEGPLKCYFTGKLCNLIKLCTNATLYAHRSVTCDTYLKSSSCIKPLTLLNSI